MPRKRSYHTVIPCKIVSGTREGKEEEILNRWGIEPRIFGFETVYKGWQRVHLPAGWTLSLEDLNFYLLDHRDQVRGEIRNALPHKGNELGSLGAELAKAYSEALAETRNPNDPPPEPPKVTLYLRNSIGTRYSFNLEGSYTYWVENGFGAGLFSIKDVDGNKDAELDKAEQTIRSWLMENYPEWEDPYAYWETFS